MKNKIISIIILTIGIISIATGSIIIFTGKDNISLNNNSNNGDESLIKVFSTNKITYVVDEKGNLYRAGEGYGNHEDDSTKFRKISKNVKSATTADLNDIVLKKNGKLYVIDPNVDEEKLLMSNVEYLVSDPHGEYALIINKEKELYVYGSISDYYKTFYYNLTESEDPDGDDFGLTSEEHEKAFNTPVKIMDNVKTVKTDGTVVAVINKKDELYIIGATSDRNLDPYGKAYKIADNVKTVEVENVQTSTTDSNCQEMIDYITKDNKLYAYGCKINFDITAKEAYRESQLIRENVEDIKIANMGLGAWIKDTNKNLYVIGNNTFGWLGGGKDIAITDFKKILSNVDKIYDGYAITKNKDLYVAGNNSAGQLCTGDNETVYDIKKVDSNVNSIEKPGNFIIKEDGAYICGTEEDGKFGFDIGKKIYTPTKLKIK